MNYRKILVLLISLLIISNFNILNGQSSNFWQNIKTGVGIGALLPAPIDKSSEKYNLPGTEFSVGANYPISIGDDNLELEFGLALNNFQFVHIVKRNGVALNDNNCYTCTNYGIIKDRYSLSLQNRLLWQRNNLAFGLAISYHYLVGNYPTSMAMFGERQTFVELILSQFNIKRRSMLLFGGSIGYSFDNLDLYLQFNLDFNKNIQLKYQQYSVDSFNYNNVTKQYDLYNPNELSEHEQTLTISSFSLHLNVPVKTLYNLKLRERKEKNSILKLTFKELGTTTETIYYERNISEKKYFDIRYGIGIGLTPTLSRGWSFSNFNMGSYLRLITGNKVKPFLDIEMFGKLVKKIYPDERLYHGELYTGGTLGGFVQILNTFIFELGASYQYRMMDTKWGIRFSRLPLRYRVSIGIYI